MKNSYRFFTFKALKAFNTAMIVTPTSANIAAHIVVIPKALKIRTIIFIPIANTMFDVQFLVSF